MLAQATARGLTVNVVYLTPSDTFASTRPSDAERPEMVRADDWHTGWVIPVEAFDRWLTAQDAGVAVCAWCPSVASGSALHNDGLRHPSCGRADHGQGWVPDPASDGAVSSRGFDLHALAADWEKVTAAAGLDPDARADEVLAALANADVAERIAQEIESERDRRLRPEGRQWATNPDWMAWGVGLMSDAARIARSHATPPVAATGEEVDHYPMSAISMRGTSAVCDWCGQVFESSDLYREHERVMVLARRAREAAATGEGDDRG